MDAGNANVEKGDARGFVLLPEDGEEYTSGSPDAIATAGLLASGAHTTGVTPPYARRLARCRSQPTADNLLTRPLSDLLRKYELGSVVFCGL